MGGEKNSRSTEKVLNVICRVSSYSGKELNVLLSYVPVLTVRL